MLRIAINSPGVEMDSDAAEDNNLATPDEIRAAIEGLSSEDFLRLKKTAKLCLFGTEYQNPLELINEAITRTLSVAHGGKGRKWKTSVPFIAFMIMSVKGIANDSLESLQQTRTVPLESMATQALTVEDALGIIGHRNSSVEELALEIEDSDERQTNAKRDADAVEEHFAADAEISWIIMGYKDGLAAKDIRELAGMSATQYATAKTRFRRGLEKLFPNRRGL